MAYGVSASHVVPGNPADVFDTVIAMPLPELFDRRIGMIPAVTELRDEPETWRAAGQTRTVVLGDGGRLREQLTAVEAPDRFGYRLEVLAGPMRLLAKGVEGEWRFAPAYGGTRVTWSWRLTLANPAALGVMPVFAVFWRRYAERALGHIEATLAGHGDTAAHP